MTVSVVSPRKSILSRPMVSRSSIAYCVVISSLLLLYSGTISCKGWGEITTPAAWVEAWRASPSRRPATSINSATRGSRSLSCRISGDCASASFSVMFRTLGTSLATRSNRDRALAREPHEVPHDQEIAGETHLLHELDFAAEAFLVGFQRMTQASRGTQPFELLATPRKPFPRDLFKEALARLAGGYLKMR